MNATELSPSAKLHASHLANRSCGVARALTTVSMAARPLFEKAFTDEPANCPCCQQLVKVYERKITSGMARAIILIYRHSKNDPSWPLQSPWLHVDRLLVTERAPTGVRGDYHKLRFWGLLEQKAERRDDDSPRNGFWRITTLGAGFVRDGVAVPGRAIIYNGECLGLEGASVTIKDAIGTKFNYAELMAGA